jgi:hypothetical protein
MQGKTLKYGMVPNPRRRRRRSRRRYGSHRRARRGVSRRYGRARRYRSNPGGMLIDLAKQAIPVLIGFYGAKVVASRLLTRLPFVASIPFQGPVLAIGTVLGVNYATKKVGALAKHRSALLLGSAAAAVDTLIQAFAPASIKSLIGMGDMGDYLAVGDYAQMGGGPIDDDIAMSDYIAVGGVEEELGVDEELGIEEELGNDLLGGVSQGSLLKQVPGRQFLAPVPSRSFTKQVPAAGGGYDNPGQLYAGIFGGGF